MAGGKLIKRYSVKVQVVDLVGMSGRGIAYLAVEDPQGEWCKVDEVIAKLAQQADRIAELELQLSFQANELKG